MTHVFSGFVTFFFIIINHKVTVLREADMEVRELYHFIGQWNIRFYFFNYKQLENKIKIRVMSWSYNESFPIPTVYQIPESE